MKTSTAFLALILGLTACGGGGGGGSTTSPPAPQPTPTPPPEQPLQPGENPIVRDIWTADPAALVHDGTVYLYAGHDEAVGDEPFRITEWVAYSSVDMRNWTSLGPIMEPTDFDWAIRRAWASEVEEKDGKFWFYTTVETEALEMAIGVAVADTPIGPFVDAKGSPLIVNDDTPDTDHWFSDIDPTVYTEDDGTSWIAWGNGNYYFAPLAENMIELAGPIQSATLPFYVEGPWLHKYQDTYYVTYAGIDPSVSSEEQIHYATAPSVDGPWTYGGLLTGSAQDSFTIHPATIEFMDQWYFFYHDGSLDLNGVEGSGGRRNVRAEYLYHLSDGSLAPIQQTRTGVSGPAAPPAE